MDFRSTNTGDCHLNPWKQLASTNCCNEFTFSMKVYFPVLGFQLVTHSAALNAFISCTETNIE